MSTERLTPDKRLLDTYQQLVDRGYKSGICYISPDFAKKLNFTYGTDGIQDAGGTVDIENEFDFVEAEWLTHSDAVLVDETHRYGIRIE